MRHLLTALILPLSTLAQPDAVREGQSIPFAQLGMEADKKGADAASSITPTATGAHLKALMQDLEAEATPEGLWLSSTAEDDLGTPNRFRIRAVGVGSGSSPRFDEEPPGGLLHFPTTGLVRVTEDTVAWIRPGLIEEYRVSTDGVRQDFIVLQRPEGAGEEMAVDLEVSGARAETADYGVKLTLAATGRELAYSRLHVTDATGRELTARLEVLSADRLRGWVEDAGAAYPVRIDPTFSDADWVALNPSIPGVNGVVLALAAGGNGNLFVGGVFTRIGAVAANSIAKWDGSAWSPMVSGINNTVRALAVIGNDLYAGGAFTTAGDLTVNRIAKWDGSAWSALGTGMNSSVWALAASGSDLYAGGAFTTAGGVPANRIAKWDGSEWSPLGAGMDTTVLALAVNGSELYAGGSFTSAGGNDVNSIAKWDGATWSALGTGMSSMVSATVKALAVMGSDLYAGGSFSTAGGTVAGNIAKWDGVGWSALGSGMNGSVDALAVSGTVLYAGGNFTIAGGTSAKGVAKWGGGTWSALGTGTSLVNALAVVGRDLYAGGSFVNPGGGIVRRIAKWDGVGWSALGMGTDNTVWALAADSSGHLFVGGDFLNAGPNISAFIAQANLPLTALESWRRDHFGIIANSGDAADFFDFEKDGLVNLIEWACGLNPTLASALTASVVRDGAVLEFTYQRSVAALNAGAMFAVEWNDAPVFTGWSTAGVSEMVMSDDGILQQVKATLSAGTLGYRFVHLKVTAPAE